MADYLGVDYDESGYNAPATDAALAFEALRCGQQLLMAYTYDDGWAVSAGGAGGTRKMARKAAQRLLDVMPSDRGRAAVAWMAQSFGRGIADIWRHAAGSGDYDGAEAAALYGNADASDELADLVARSWPVVGYDDAMAHIAHAGSHRFFDPGNPDALVDLHSYSVRTRATTEALAIAVGDRFDRYAAALIGPVMSFNFEFDAGVLADWNLTSEYWSNLLDPHPLPHIEVLDRIAAEYGR